MTKPEFKKRWEANDNGGGITYEDIADCAKEWGLYSRPKICPIDRVTYDVLVSAGVKDAEEYKPEDY